MTASITNCHKNKSYYSQKSDKSMQITSAKKSRISACLLTPICYMGTAVLGYKFAPIHTKIYQFIFDLDRTCTKLPSAIYSYSSTVSQIVQIVPVKSQLMSVIIADPIVEEMIYRVGLQSLLLKKIPAYLCQKWDINCSINSKITAAARVIFTAIAFALYHIVPPENGLPNCSMSRIYSVFLVGLILSALQEKTGNVAYPILFHMSFNLGVFMNALNKKHSQKSY